MQGCVACPYGGHIGQDMRIYQFYCCPEKQKKGKQSGGNMCKAATAPLSSSTPFSPPTSLAQQIVLFSTCPPSLSHPSSLSNPLIAKKLGIIASNFSFMAASLIRSKYACHCKSVAGVSRTHTHTHTYTFLLPQGQLRCNYP